MPGSRALRRSARAGFTLIEMMAVLLILALLVGVLVVQLSGVQEVVEVGDTEQRLARIGAAISGWEIDRGEWPRSSFTAEQGTPPNEFNLGVECLVLGLWSEETDGAGLEDGWLDNTDGDETKKRLASAFGDRQLREIVDAWGNPVAYFHHVDYGRTDLYTTFDPATGEPLESAARALRNSDTGRYFRKNKFQLISAGLDGEFGTEDDIVNFERP